MAAIGTTGFIHAAVNDEFSLAQFARYCSRSIGYLYPLRDDDQNGFSQRIDQAPDYGKDYIDEALAQAEAKLKALQDATKETALAMCQTADAEQRQWREDHHQKLEKELVYVRALLKQANEWEPPTPGHSDLKALMVGQLKSAISDYQSSISYNEKELEKWLTKKVEMGTDGWPVEWTAKKAALEADVAKRKADQAEAIQRNVTAQAWLDALNLSLDGPPAEAAK